MRIKKIAVALLGLVALVVVVAVRQWRGQGLSSAEGALHNIDQLIQQKNYTEAVSAAVRDFKLDNSECADLQMHSIDAEDTGGEEVVAFTNFDQIVQLDPRRDSFLNARFLVSTLAHEFVHCSQHQALYRQVVETNPQLIFLRDHLLHLKDLASLSELAVGASKEDSSVASKRFHDETKRLDLNLAPLQVLEFEKTLSADLSYMANLLRNYFEIGPIVKALEFYPVVRSPPKGETPTEEFAFHLRYLRIAMERVDRESRGSCALNHNLPATVRRDYEDSCRHARELLGTYAN